MLKNKTSKACRLCNSRSLSNCDRKTTVSNSSQVAISSLMTSLRTFHRLSDALSITAEERSLLEGELSDWTSNFVSFVEDNHPDAFNALRSSFKDLSKEGKSMIGSVVSTPNVKAPSSKRGRSEEFNEVDEDLLQLTSDRQTRSKSKKLRQDSLETSPPL
jgi:hypothetical protein